MSETTRRDVLKVLSVLPVIAVSGRAGAAAIAGAAIGVGMAKPPRPLRRVLPGSLITSKAWNDVVDAVNHANGFPPESER